MRVRAQLMMVMALDKCIGCHTCSVTCKQAWTNRSGTDYVWFNNVETKPGVGYPKRWEDNEHWKGGWALDGKGRLKLKAGGRIRKLLSIFGNPDLPQIDDYYEPWTYEYANLVSAPLQEHSPVVQSRSRLTGEPLKLTWGPNWDDNLAGTNERFQQDPNAASLGQQAQLEYEQVFMFYLPRICNHCLNPACVASCPSGAMYKRVEDGIVLVDQNACRGWRMCVSGCPYKKVYFNHVSGKAEKCTFCYPRIEDGQPTICSETCVGRIRYIGVVLYDVDAVTAAAQTPEAHDLVEAHRRVMLDPRDPEVLRAAERSGVPFDWLQAAQNSPVYALAKDLRVALPLHPEFRTMPMVWYVPPLAPMADNAADAGFDADDTQKVLAGIENLRIPIDYLASIFSAGNAAPVRDALRRLTVLRAVKRAMQFGEDVPDDLLAAVGFDDDDVEKLFRLLAVGEYRDRYVIPTAHREDAGALQTQHCSLDFPGGPGVAEALVGQGQGAEFRGLGSGGIPATDGSGSIFVDGDGNKRFNLLGWNGELTTGNPFGQAGAV
ncbi:MAG: Nitrate reductase subunit beta [Actinomycetota bacterium]|nr:Nitrate reductase subunit beta [Actinomycetota bacterium]